jgi:hypothetical protein
MAVTINADNGAVSGSSGLKYSADSTGVLALQTNGTTAVSISTGQVITLTQPLPAASGGTGTTAGVTPTAVSDQLNSSTGYLDLPVGTTAQRPGSPVAGMIRFNTTKDKYEVYSGTSSSWLDINTTNTEPYNIDYLVVAGGGGTAGNRNGGGGAGGLLSGSGAALTPLSTYVITVGAGGTGGAGNVAVTSTQDGTASSFSTFTPSGGGGNSRNGGSGGGGNIGGAGGTGVSGQGNAGGVGISTPSQSAGGGGGAGAVGGAGSGSTAGAGGVGVASSITGSSVTYAGGGGGGGDNTAGAGGTGGGGAGAAGLPSTQVKGTNGTANTGGGGGGGSDYLSTPVTQSNGGSGVVILSIPTTRYSGTTTGSPTVTTSGANTILKFTGSGSYTA